MATTATPQASTQTVPAIRRRSLTIGAITVVVAVAAVAWAVLKTPNPEASQVSSLPYVAAVAVLVGAVLFAWLVPARAAAGSTGFILALVSVPLMWAFWSALPFVVGVAAIVLAVTHRGAGGARRGLALAAIIIASLTSLLTLVAVLLG